MNINATSHAIHVRFKGPTNTKEARWIATWTGWPSEGSRRIRRTFPYDHIRRTFPYDHTRGTGAENFAECVAQAFVDWLNKGPRDYTGNRDTFGHNVVRSVHVGALGPDEYAVLVDLADTRDT